VRLRSLRSLRRTTRPTTTNHRRSRTEYADDDDGVVQLINTVHEIGSGPLLHRIYRVLLHEAIDPNYSRHGLLVSVEQRTHRLHPMAIAA